MFLSEVKLDKRVSSCHYFQKGLLDYYDLVFLLKLFQFVMCCFFFPHITLWSYLHTIKLCLCPLGLHRVYNVELQSCGEKLGALHRDK